MGSFSYDAKVNHSQANLKATKSNTKTTEQQSAVVCDTDIPDKDDPTENRTPQVENLCHSGFCLKSGSFHEQTTNT